MIKPKYQTTILLRPEEYIKQDMETVLNSLFWRQSNLSKPALNFLKIIKKEGISDNYWQTFCKKEKITRGQYDSIIKKLRRAGLIYKRDNTFMLSNSFDAFLKQIIAITKKWKES